MTEVYIFKCNECGRVAEDFKWPKQAEEEFGPAHQRYPQPICPDCDSKDIDLNHDYREE